MEIIHMSPRIRARLVKVGSTHNRLRTDVIEGDYPYWPAVGKRFLFVAPPLDPMATVRTIDTSPVQEVVEEPRGVFTFKTLNSTYRLEMFCPLCQATGKLGLFALPDVECTNCRGTGIGRVTTREEELQACQAAIADLEKKAMRDDLTSEERANVWADLEFQRALLQDLSTTWI